MRKFAVAVRSILRLSNVSVLGVSVLGMYLVSAPISMAQDVAMDMDLMQTIESTNDNL